MSNALRTGGIEKYDELHIDRIDEAWRLQATWIWASLEALDLAASIRDRAGYDLSVVLAFSLRPAIRNMEVDFSTEKQLTERIGHTPPSLYLFPRGKEPWTRPGMGGTITRRIEPGFFGASGKARQGFYMKFKAADHDEYYESLFVKA